MITAASSIFFITVDILTFMFAVCGFSKKSFGPGHSFVCQQFFQANSKHSVVDQGAGRADRSFALSMHKHGLVG